MAIIVVLSENYLFFVTEKAITSTKYRLLEMEKDFEKGNEILNARWRSRQLKAIS